MRNSLIISAAVFSLLFLSPATAQPGSDSRNYNPYGYNNRFSSSMAIIVAVLVAALFFMGFFSIYIRHCSAQAQAAAGVGAANGAVTGRSRRAARGLDAAVISTFPTMEYSEVKGLKIGKGALECAVCICEFEDDETLRLIPKCDHVFHPECIDTWLGSHTTCPVCRAELGAVPEIQPDIEAPSAPAAAAAAEPEPAEREPEPAALSRSLTSRIARLFPRSHSTGHSVVQAGESTERFTLRLPAEVRKEMVSRQLQRASSMVALPRGGSSRRAGYRTGADRMTRSDRWVPFFSRMLSMKSPKVAAENVAAGEESSDRVVLGMDVPRSDSPRPPV